MNFKLCFGELTSIIVRVNTKTYAVALVDIVGKEFDLRNTSKSFVKQDDNKSPYQHNGY